MFERIIDYGQFELTSTAAMFHRKKETGRMLKILLAFPFNLDYSRVSSLSAEILIIQEMQIKFEGTYSSIDENFEFS